MTANESILSRYTSVKLPDDAVVTSAIIEPRIRDVAEAILENTERSREQQLALTKLEEVKMWALRAAALDAEARSGDRLQPLSADLQEKGA